MLKNIHFRSDPRFFSLLSSIQIKQSLRKTHPPFLLAARYCLAAATLLHALPTTPVQSVQPLLGRPYLFCVIAAQELANLLDRKPGAFSSFFTSLQHWKGRQNLIISTIIHQAIDMHLITSAITLLLFLSQALAVSLNDFTPRLTDLTGACQKLYTTTIDGCEQEDFTQGKCSASCVNALLSLGTSVRKSCEGQGEQGTIIAAFLNGQGSSQLCPNAEGTTSSSTSSSVRIGSSTLVLKSTSVTSSSLIVDTSDAPSSTVVALRTQTIQPQPASQTDEESAVSITSTITGTSLAFDTSTPVGIATANGLSIETSQTTTHAAAKQTGDKYGGTPMDASSAAAVSYTAQNASFWAMCAFLVVLLGLI